MASILVIDDNYDMLEMLRIALSHRGGHEVFLSTSGQEGLEMAKSELPDLAIVDVMMPEMDGYEVVRQLRAESSTKKMGIIILTARGQPVDKQAALESGADSFMVKPVKPQDLLDEIEKLLDIPQKGSGGLFSIVSLRGGVGTTTLATNLALLLQRLDSTALLDFSPNSGHCASLLKLQPKRHWGELIKSKNVKDEELSITNLMTKHPSGMGLLAAPPIPLSVEQVPKAYVKPILNLMGEAFRFVIIDMPSVLGAVSTMILEKSTKIVLVCGPDPLGIQSTKGLLRALKKHRDKLILVLNSVNTGPQVSVEKVSKTLLMPVMAQVPYHENQLKNIYQGSPAVVSQPDSSIAKALEKVVHRLTEKG